MTTAYVTDRAALLVADCSVREVTDLGGGRVRAKVGGYIVGRSASGG